MIEQPKFVIGRSTANGFTSFCSGDLFQLGRQFYRLCAGGYGWTLRPTISADGHRTDYQAPPLEGWIEIKSAIELAQKLNDAEAAAQCPHCSGHHPVGCCAQDGHGG